MEIVYVVYYSSKALGNGVYGVYKTFQTANKSAEKIRKNDFYDKVTIKTSRIDD